MLTCVNQMTIHRLMSLIAMAFLWTGSQIPVYLFGMSTPFVMLQIDRADMEIQEVSHLISTVISAALTDGFGSCLQIYWLLQPYVLL